MAFTYTIEAGSKGDRKTVRGTYTNTAGSTGGTIDTGFVYIDSVFTDDGTQSATTNKIAISGGTITLTTVANETGNWEATGY